MRAPISALAAPGNNSCRKHGFSDDNLRRDEWTRENGVGTDAARRLAGTGLLHIHFSDCELDVAAFELRRGGQPCPVEPQVFEMLLYLARNPDRLVTKSDLIENVWGGRIVSDSTLASRIKSARRAIGDDGEQQRLIRTVHGRGVRFIGEIREERAPDLETADAVSEGAE